MTIKQQGGIFGRNPTFNDVEVDGSLSLGDSKKATFGASGDLEIYHSGSTSFIKDVGTGDLQIFGGDDVFIRGSSTNNYMARFREEGSVDLYHNNIMKFQTVSSGISVQGNVTVTDGNGIDFSATSGTGTSELFDDYEEGNWTPVIDRASTPGTYTTGSNDYGVYTRIGDTVYISCRLNGTLSGGSGTLIVTGMPFNLAGSQLSALSYYNLSASAGESLRWRDGNKINFTGTYTSGDNVIISGTYKG